MPISFVRAATSPSLSIRFKESVPFLSAARRTQEFAVWIDYEAFDYDTHQLTRVALPACCNFASDSKSPSSSDREALRASAHSLCHSNMFSPFHFPCSPCH